MFSNLAERPLNASAYSDRPFTFLGQSELNDLANITAINLVENGDRIAREHWQNRQLRNLLRHAQARSKFWRQRIPSRPVAHGTLRYLPMQRREDVAKQTALEGSLVASDRASPAVSYASTGSTGVPVEVFVAPENAYYNLIRGLAQFFFDGLSLQESRTQIIPASSMAKLKRERVAVQWHESWAGPLSKVFSTGPTKRITHSYDDDALIEELTKDRIGYLVSPSRYIAILLSKGGLELIKKLEIKLWFHNADYRDPEIVNSLKSVGISSLSNYSAGEIGPIAFECSKHNGYFHVAHSNVIVECDQQATVTFNDVSVGKLLITHLHSYATPLIRYDVGDFAQLEQTCPCGHDGSTISNIFGRGKHFVRLSDGTLRPFYLSTRLLQHAVAFTECRIRQPDLDTITVEIGGRDNLSLDEEAQLKELIIKATDSGFHIKITTVKEIDWSGNPKRLFFSSAVA